MSRSAERAAKELLRDTEWFRLTDKMVGGSEQKYAQKFPDYEKVTERKNALKEQFVSRFKDTVKAMRRETTPRARPLKDHPVVKRYIPCYNRQK